MLLATFCVSCGEKTKDTAVKSVENIENNGDDSIANTVAEADVNKEKIEEIAKESAKNTNVLDATAEVGKEAIDLSAKHPKEVVKNSSQNTKDGIRNAEEKTKDVEVANKLTETVAEKPAKNTGAVVSNAEENAKGTDVAVGKAKQSFEGFWNMGEDNTIIEIKAENGTYVGRIASSDNAKAKIGGLILKDVKSVDGIWKGKLYSPRKNEWFDAVLKTEGNLLLITVNSGRMSKTLKWSKA